LLFFSKWQALKLPRWDNSEFAGLDYVNVDPFIGLIISEGKASYKELKEDYSLEDAYILYECIMVPKANEYLAYKNAEKKAKK
jgi:hypothetical protein